MTHITRPAPIATGTEPAFAHGAVAGARLLFALLFIVSGIQKAFAFEDVAGWMASEGVPFAALVLTATIAFEVAAGAAVLLGMRLRYAAGLLAAFVLAATLVFHAFWAAPAEQFADQLTHFLKNAAIVGGLLLLANVDRTGR